LQIQNDDDATVATAATGLTQEQNNEIRRIQANIKNLGANLAAIFKQE
jgi:subtilase family serine protease